MIQWLKVEVAANGFVITVSGVRDGMTPSVRSYVSEPLRPVVEDHGDVGLEEAIKEVLKQWRAGR